MTKNLRSLLVCIASCTIFLPSNGISQSELAEPYRSINILPFHGQGWYGNTSQIEELISQNKHIKTVIEVGSWIGQSTRHIASLLPADGKVYAVDHWLGSAEHQPGQSAWTQWNPSLASLYQQFLSNVIHAKLTHKIIPIRMKSLEAAQALAVKPDLIYIDAGHETEAVYADLCAWYPHVEANGILCGDDWGWPSVAAAVERFARERNLTIKAQYNFWRLEKKR